MKRSNRFVSLERRGHVLFSTKSYSSLIPQIKKRWNLNNSHSIKVGWINEWVYHVNLFHLNMQAKETTYVFLQNAVFQRKMEANHHKCYHFNQNHYLNRCCFQFDNKCTLPLAFFQSSITWLWSLIRGCYTLSSRQLLQILYAPQLQIGKAVSSSCESTKSFSFWFVHCRRHKLWSW